MQIGPNDRLNTMTCKNISKIIMKCLYDNDIRLN